MTESIRPSSRETVPEQVRLNTLLSAFQERGMWQIEEVREVLAAAAESLGIDDLSERLDVADCRHSQFALWTVSPALKSAIVAFLEKEHPLNTTPTLRPAAPQPRAGIVERQARDVAPQLVVGQSLTAQEARAKALEEAATALLSDVDRDAERQRRRDRSQRERTAEGDDKGLTHQIAKEPVESPKKPTVPVAEQLKYARARLLAKEHGDGYVRELRPHQIDFVHRFDEYFLALTDSSTADQPDKEISSGNPLTSFARIEAAPRTGKTTVAAEIIRRTNLKTVYFVPYVGLAYQAEKELQALLPDKKIALYIGERKDALADVDVVISTYHMSQVQMGMHAQLPVAFQEAPLIFTDEGHESTTDRRMDVLHRGFDEHAIRIALTGTPDYSEVRRLKDSYPTLIHRLRTPEAFSLDLLSPFEYFVFEIDVDASGVTIEETITGPEYDQKEVAKRMSQAPVNELIAHFRAESANALVPALITVSGKQQAEDVAILLQERGFRTAMVVDDTPNRQEILEQYEKGELDTLVTVRVLLRGWDSARCKLLIDASPGISPVNSGQKYTRPMTKLDEAVAKMYCIVPRDLPVTPLLPPDVLLDINTPLPPGVICRANSENVKDPQIHSTQKQLQFSGMKARPVFDLREYGGTRKIEINYNDLPLLREIIMTGVRGLQEQKYDEAAFIDLISHYRRFQNTYFEHSKFKGYGQLLLWSAGIATERDFIDFMNRSFPIDRSHAIIAYGREGSSRGFGSDKDDQRYQKIQDIMPDVLEGSGDVSTAIDMEEGADTDLLDSDPLLRAFWEKNQEKIKGELSPEEQRLLIEYLDDDTVRQNSFQFQMLLSKLRSLFPDVETLRDLNRASTKHSERYEEFLEIQKAIKQAILQNPETPTVWSFMSLLPMERWQYGIEVDGRRMDLITIADRLGLKMEPVTENEDFAYLCKVLFSEPVLEAARKQYLPIAKTAFEDYLRKKSMTAAEWLITPVEKISEDEVEVNGRLMDMQRFIHISQAPLINERGSLNSNQVDTFLRLLYTQDEYTTIKVAADAIILERERVKRAERAEKLREKQEAVLRAFQEDGRVNTAEKAYRYFVYNSEHQRDYSVTVGAETLSALQMPALWPELVGVSNSKYLFPEQLVRFLAHIFPSDDLEAVRQIVEAEITARHQAKETQDNLRTQRHNAEVKKAMEVVGTVDYWILATIHDVNHFMVLISDDTGASVEKKIQDVYQKMHTRHQVRYFLQQIFGKAAVNEAYQKKYKEIQERRLGQIKKIRESILSKYTLAAFLLQQPKQRQSMFFEVKHKGKPPTLQSLSAMVNLLDLSELDIYGNDNEDFYTFARIIFGDEAVDPIISRIKESGRPGV